MGLRLSIERKKGHYGFLLDSIMASLHFHIHIFRLFYGCDVHIIPDDTQSRIIALALGNPVEHLRSLLLHTMLSQGSTSNSNEIHDVPILAYEWAVRFD